MLIMIVMYLFFMMFSLPAHCMPYIYAAKSGTTQKIYFPSDDYSLQSIHHTVTDTVNKKTFFVEHYQWSTDKEQQLENLMKDSWLQSIECIPVSLPKQGVVIILFYSNEYDCTVQTGLPFDTNFKGFIVEVYHKERFNTVLQKTQYLLHRT